MTTKLTAAQTEIKELQEIRDRLIKERNDLRSKLDATVHENCYMATTIRSLHVSLNRAYAEIRAEQIKQKKFGADSVEWVALAQ